MLFELQLICGKFHTADTDDYEVPASFEIVFFTDSTEGIEECVTIVITDDDVLEGDHDFHVFLVNTWPPVTIGDPSSATVTIEDNESKSTFATTITCIYSYHITE